MFCMENNEPASEAMLIDGCVQGDRKAQAELFHRYFDRLNALVYRILGPIADLDDVVQEVFMKIFKSIGQFKGSGALDGWIYRITINQCREEIRMRRRKRQVEMVPHADHIIENVTSSTPNPEETLSDKEDTHLIYSALSHIKLEKRVVLVMHDMEDKTMDEIAVTIQVPLGTVKSRLFHARSELHKRLTNPVKGRTHE